LPPSLHLSPPPARRKRLQRLLHNRHRRGRSDSRPPHPLQEDRQHQGVPLQKEGGRHGLHAEHQGAGIGEQREGAEQKGEGPAQCQEGAQEHIGYDRQPQGERGGVVGIDEKRREKRRERRLWTTLCGHVYEVSSCFSVAVMFMLLVLLCFFVFFFFFFFFFSSTLSNQPPSFPSSSYFLFPLPSSLFPLPSPLPLLFVLQFLLFLNSSSSIPLLPPLSSSWLPWTAAS